MSESTSEMMHGIVDKKITGIGATSLEINAKRNSIIVVPSKSIAYTKSLSTNNLLYVGSPIGSIRSNVSKRDIRKYISDPNVTYKKIIVVADSLRKVIEVIGVDNYPNYFLLIDEIDCYQADSTYRSNLENVIDYYLEYPENNRALVTATFKEFSNLTLKQEIKTILRYPILPVRDINLYNTNNPNAATVEAIKVISRIKPIEKIVIAYNSIVNILNIIELLDDDQKNECSIICGENSMTDAGEYYLDFKGEYLSSRITFITSSIFRGVDIKEQFHLISVANSSKSHTLLSTANLTQIAGRCREGLYSETVIYSTKKLKKIDIDEYRDKLLFEAQSVINIIKSFKDNPNLKIVSSDKIIQSLIENTGVQNGQKFIPITRNNIHQENVISYLNIDALTEIKFLETWLYSMPQNLKDQLVADGHNVRYRKRFFIFTEEQHDNNTKLKEYYKKNRESKVELLLDEISDSSQCLNEDYFDGLLLEKNEIEKVLIVYLKTLYEYYNIDDLIILFKNAIPEKRSYTNLYNSLIYKAISNNTPFKAAMLELFSKGVKMTKEKVYDNLNYILNTFFKMEIKSTNNIVKYLNIFYC